MQIIAVEIEDNHSDNMPITKNKNLDYDPYFYKRQKELSKLRKDIKSGDMEMLSQEQYDKEIKSFFNNFKNIAIKDLL